MVYCCNLDKKIGGKSMCKYKVVIIDDDENFVANLKKFLEDSDFEIYGYTNGPEAMEFLKRRENVSCILLDQQFELDNLSEKKSLLFRDEEGSLFSEMDNISPDIENSQGLLILKILKKEDSTKNIPVIFCTAYGDSEKGETAINQGAVDYVTKGESFNNLIVTKLKDAIGIIIFIED